MASSAAGCVVIVGRIKTLYPLNNSCSFPPAPAPGIHPSSFLSLWVPQEV
ncbi:crystallin lambda 1 [Homo sapiens]|uniref:Crystallin lambda 1 n=1 Tax=Homo sapiens TaxID=9606 RepID=A0A2R8Y699_HUMAN|nr:crystallin lambda 1 [Homo sapiens]KAI4062814.1 crystallin lambda 1 [Homo sapiens]